MSTHAEPPPQRPTWLLRRADQAAVAGLALAALISLAVYWCVQGGAAGRLIEIDREPRRQVEFLVDLNQADWPELAQLPEIGESLAKRIVEMRRERGPYLDHEDLRRVRGIGPKTLERIRPYLRPMPPGENVAGR
ncbi:MAG TPA: helix-hairpin-helix domain-containing protein [Pirellulales bacterium]|nr:helix-hairpin-helix domain-containing protein [Pirellulales bacterium]